MAANRSRCDTASTGDSDFDVDRTHDLDTDTEATTDVDHRLPSPRHRPPASDLERQHLEEALSRLESRGDLTTDQRAVVAQLARSITTAVAPSAIVVRAARGHSGCDRPNANPDANTSPDDSDDDAVDRLE